MPITQSQALEAVRAAVASATGVVAIIARYDAVRPATPYCTVDIIDVDEIGYPQVQISPYTLSSLEELRVQVTGYGLGMDAMLQSAKKRLWTPDDSVGASLIAAGVYPQRTTSLAHITAPYRTGQEPRWTFDLIAQYEWVDADAAAGVDAAASIVVDIHARGAVAADAEPAIVIPEVP